MSKKESKGNQFSLAKVDSQSIITVVAALALVIYSVFIKKDYNEISTEKVNGVLSNKPYIKETGGDFTYYHLYIHLIGSSESYVVSYCAFDALDTNYLDILEKGKEVTLTVKADKKKETSEYKVLGIRCGNLEVIDTKVSMSCHNRSWIKNSFLLFISLIMIGFELVRVYRKASVDT